MSSSNDDIYTPNSSPDHFLLGIGLTAAFLIFIAVVTTIAYCIGRRRGLAGVLHDPEGGGGGAAGAEPGLDDAALKAFPVLLFSEANPSKLLPSSAAGCCGGGGGGGSGELRCYSTALSCSVCLADYGESELLRVLPDCGHVFHLKCVDSWLRLHPTCPICRNLAKSASRPTSPDDSSSTEEPTG